MARLNRRGARRRSALLALAGASFISSSALAVDRYWQTLDNGNWNDPAGWTPPTIPPSIPSAGDDVYIGSGTAGANITVNINADVVAHRIYLGGATENGQNVMGDGTINQTAGNVHLIGGAANDSWFHAGNRPGATGTYNISGGSFTEDNDVMTFGDDGTGFFNLSGSATVTTPNMTFGRWTTGRGTGVQTGGTLTVMSGTASGDLDIGRRGTGAYTLENGIINTLGDFSIGRGDDLANNPTQPANGTFTQNGGTVTVGASLGQGGWMYLGGHDTGTGTGTYNMNGGTLNSRTRIQIAQGPGSTGTFNQTNGIVNTGTAEIGHGGVGTYNLSGGTFNTSESAVVGAWNQGDGRLVVTGGTLNAAQALLVGRGSGNAADNANPRAGLVDQQGGVINAGWAEIGTTRVAGQTFVGTYRLSNGQLNTQFEIVVGRNNGEGVFQMSGGTVNSGLAPVTDTGAQRTFIVGRGATGRFDMSGGVINAPQKFIVGQEEAGRLGLGTATHQGGTINSGGFDMAINGSTGTYNLSGGGELRQRDQADPTNQGGWNFFATGPNPNPRATMNISGGTVSLDARVLLASSPGSIVDVTQTGGLYEVRHGEMTIGDQGAATYNITGGTLRTLNPENGNPDTSGHITVGQWDTSVGRLNVGGTGLVEAAANLQLADGRGDGPPSTGFVDQSGGTVRVGVAGAGNLTMATNTPGVATYTLRGGVLDLTGGNLTQGAGTATFAMTGGELRNVNAMNFPLNQEGGKLSVGNDIGTTAITGGYQLGAPGILEVAINGLTPGTQHDQLTVTGDVLLAGALSVLSGFDAAVGDQFLILDNQGGNPITGNVLGLPEGATLSSGSEMYRITYLGGSGNDVVLTNVVPEPATLGLGILGGIYWLSRRRAR